MMVKTANYPTPQDIHYPFPRGSEPCTQFPVPWVIARTSEIPAGTVKTIGSSCGQGFIVSDLIGRTNDNEISVSVKRVRRWVYPLHAFTHQFRKE